MSKRVLIVEDSAMMRKMLFNVIQDAGHVVVGQANSGTEAIEQYKQLQPDLVTMDITMRGMNGITAAKEILEIDSGARVLILSNLDDDKYKHEAEKIGAIGFVNKHQTDFIVELIGQS